MDHALLVDGIDVVSALVTLSGFTSGVNLRNGYLLVTAESDESIESVAIENHFNGTTTPVGGVPGDGLIFDPLAQWSLRYYHDAFNVPPEVVQEAQLHQS